KAAPKPFSSSLLYEIYRLLPNDTDLTVFKRTGLPGLNFAYVNGATYYHSPRDSFDNVDQGSLQHQGSYALALARQFGNISLGDNRSGNAIYFNTFGSSLIRYPASWAIPLMILLLAALICLIALGFKRQRLTVRGILLGVVAFLLSAVMAIVAVTFVWWLIRRFYRGYEANPLGA